jgi:fructokinase
LLDLLSIAKIRILDFNLRAPHYKQAVLENLLRQADKLKMNEIELDEISEWYADISLFNDKVRIIRDRYAIPPIIVTKGAEGASNFDGKIFYEHPGFKVNEVGAVGSGDAFLAGFLHRLADNCKSEETLEFAFKLGSYVTSKKGACATHDGTI